MSNAEALPTASPTPPIATWRTRLPTLISIYGIILTLVLLLTVVTIGNPAFLSQQNIFNMASQWAPAGIMAVGMTFVILTGGFDLSVASAYSLCAVVAAYVWFRLMRWSFRLMLSLPRDEPASHPGEQS